MENEELTNKALTEPEALAEAEALTEETPAEAEVTATDKPDKKKKAALTPEQKKAKSKKITTVITYTVALLCLLAGLFAPLFYTASDIPLTDKIFFRYVPGYVNVLLYPFLKKDLIPLPADGWFLSFGSLATESFQLDVFLNSLFITLYALVCVLGVIMLIPVIAGKKEKSGYAVCAYIVEILATLFVGYTIFSMVTEFQWHDDFAYNFLIAFGGALLMLVIQSILHKGGLGVTKLFFLLLSGIGFFLLLDVTVFAPPTVLDKPLGAFSALLGCGDTALFVNGFNGFEQGLNALYFYRYLSGAKIYDLILSVALGVLVYLTAANFVIDQFALVTGRRKDKSGIVSKNKPSSVFAFIRYGLALIAAIVAILLLIFREGSTPGLYLYALAVIILIELIFALIRAAALSSKHKKSLKAAQTAAAEENDPLFEEDFGSDEGEATEELDTITLEAPVYESSDEVIFEEPAAETVEEPVEEVYEEPVFEEPVEEIYEEPAEEQLTIPGTVPPIEEERTVVYNYRAVYNGPTDEFMDTLTDEEKIEFVQVFHEKTKGKISGVPDYVIGQDNSDFFPAIFIHINRTRNLVSSGLLEKIYKQIGK